MILRRSSTARVHTRYTLEEWFSGSQYIGTLLHHSAHWMSARCADLEMPHTVCVCPLGSIAASCQPRNSTARLLCAYAAAVVEVGAGREA